MCKVAGIRGYEYSGLAFAVMKIRLARSYDDDGGHDGVLVEIVHGNRSMTIVHRREVLGATRFPPTCPALGGRKLGGEEIGRLGSYDAFVPSIEFCPSYGGASSRNAAFSGRRDSS